MKVKIGYIILSLILIFISILLLLFKEKPKNNRYTDISYFQTTFVEPYSCKSKEVDLSSIDCPIPKGNRVFNYTGTQCVFSTIETLANYAEYEELIHPNQITSWRQCQSYSNPNHAGSILKSKNIKFTQSYSNKEASLELIRKCMKEGRGCLFSIPGHAMTLVHYSNEENRVCFIDNSDRNLKVQQRDMKWFNKYWRGWVLAVYRTPDKIPRKNPLGKRLLIENEDGKNYSNKYPFPQS